MIKIQYKDKANWTDINGKITNWTNYAVKFKDDRVQPIFMAPNTIQDTWNGKEVDILHEKYDYFSFEITVKESEKQAISQLISCSDIIITDFDTDSNQLTINQTYTVDTTKSDNIQIEEIESNIGQTSGGKYKIMFRTNRTIIYKCFSVNSTNNLIVNGNTYYTDFDVIDYSKDAEPVWIDWPDGTRKKARTIDKVGKQLLIYQLTSAYDELITDLKAVNSIAINGTSYIEIEWEVTAIAENLWKVIISGISTTTQTNFSLNPNNTYTLSMNSGATTYTSDWPVDVITRDPVDIYVDWPDGTQKIARSISKKAYQFVYFSTNPEAFIKDVKRYNDVTYSGSVLTEIEITQEEFAPEYYKITVNGVFETTTTNFTLNPDATYTLSMNSGGISYTSDYPVYEDIRDVQKIGVEWDDGSTKILQTIKKQTYKFVYFTDDPETFITRINSYSDVTYSGHVLTEIEITREEIVLGLHKITVDGVYNVDVDTFFTEPTTGFYLTLTDETPTAHTYYYEFSSRKIPESADRSTIDNNVGVKIHPKTVTKQVFQLRFYFFETKAFDLKAKCELFKPGWSGTINGGLTVYEIINSDNITPTLVEGSTSIYEILVNCLTNVTTN